MCADSAYNPSELKQTYESKIKEYHNWNFGFNVASAGLDDVGLSLVSYATVLPAFLTTFTKSNFIIGLLPALYVSCWTLPQIISPLFFGHLRKNKHFIVFIKTGYAFPWLLLSIFTLLLLKQQSPRLSLLLFFVLVCLFALLVGFAVPPWTSFISKLIFPNNRRRFFVVRFFIGTTLGILGSFLVKFLLDKFQYPINFSLIFLFAFSIFLLSTIFLAVSEEPAAPAQAKSRTLSTYFGGLAGIVKADKSLWWYIVAGIVRSFGGALMAGAFFTVYAINKLHINISQTATFMGIMLTAQLMGTLLLGYVFERTNSLVMQTLTRIFEVLSVSMILLLPNIWGVYSAFVFFALAGTSMKISEQNMVIELAPTGQVDKYMGLINTMRSPFLIVAPLIGGLLADVFSYKLVFSAALVGSLVSGAVLITKVRLHSNNDKF